MRTRCLLNIVVIAVTFCGSSIVRCGEMPDWQPKITLQRIDRKVQVEGYWTLGAEWKGSMGLALELKNGQFRYWFYSDVPPPKDASTNPVAGKFILSDGILVLETNERVYNSRWILVSFNGRTGLFPLSGFETITTRKESPSERMLYRLSDTVEPEGWPIYNETRVEKQPRTEK